MFTKDNCGYTHIFVILNTFYHKYLTFIIFDMEYIKDVKFNVLYIMMI